MSTPPAPSPHAARAAPSSSKEGAAGSPAVVRLTAVRKAFREGGRDRVVLDDLEATLNAGEFVVLLGPSGSGKSTLLNLVSGIDLPDAGSIRVAGRELTELSERDRTLFRRRHLGFVFQFYNLLPTLTVRENLLLPVELGGGVDEAAERRARSLLDRVDLADRVETFPDRLSGGEQQRIALCRALMHRPDLILADEPTGNLDPETGATILELLDELVRGEGRTLLAVTHARELADRADRVLRLEKGRIVEGG